MRYISSEAAVAALVSCAAASKAPVVHNAPIGITYSATLPSGNANITGAVKGAGAPNGQGTNFQVTFYNLPSDGGANLTYAIYSGKVKGTNCGSAGSVLDPYAGTSGSGCKQSEPAACEIGDLSGKHGGVVANGGAGTGYFTAK